MLIFSADKDQDAALNDLHPSVDLMNHAAIFNPENFAEIVGVHRNLRVRTEFCPGEMPYFPGLDELIQTQDFHRYITTIHFFVTTRPR